MSSVSPIKPATSWKGSDGWSSIALGESKSDWYKKRERLVESNTANGACKCEHDFCPFEEFMMSPKSFKEFVYRRLRIWFYSMDIANGREGPAPQGAYWAEEPEEPSEVEWHEITNPPWSLCQGLELEYPETVVDSDEDCSDPILQDKFDFVQLVVKENDLSAAQSRDRHLFFTLPIDERVRRFRTLALELSNAKKHQSNLPSLHNRRNKVKEAKQSSSVNAQYQDIRGLATKSSSN